MVSHEDSLTQSQKITRKWPIKAPNVNVFPCPAKQNIKTSFTHNSRTIIISFGFSYASWRYISRLLCSSFMINISASTSSLDSLVIFRNLAAYFVPVLFSFTCFTTPNLPLGDNNKNDYSWGMTKGYVPLGDDKKYNHPTHKRKQKKYLPLGYNEKANCRMIKRIISGNDRKVIYPWGYDLTCSLY